MAARPRSFPYTFLRFQERSITGIRLSSKVGGIAILDDAAILNHERARKSHGLANIVRDAQQSNARPVITSTRQQVPSLMPIKPPKRLIEKSKAHAASQQGASKADALAFSARNQATAFAEFGLQSVGQFFEKLAKFGLLYQACGWHSFRIAIAQARKKTSIPHLH